VGVYSSDEPEKITGLKAARKPVWGGKTQTAKLIELAARITLSARIPDTLNANVSLVCRKKNSNMGNKEIVFHSKKK